MHHPYDSQVCYYKQPEEEEEHATGTPLVSVKAVGKPRTRLDRRGAGNRSGIIRAWFNRPLVRASIRNFSGISQQHSRMVNLSTCINILFRLRIPQRGPSGGRCMSMLNRHDVLYRYISSIG